MDSIIKLGQFIRYQRLRKGLTQFELSMRVFNKPNKEYIGRLERGIASGITFATADKILIALGCEMEFYKYQYQRPNSI